MLSLMLYLLCCFCIATLWRRNSKSSILSPPDLSGRLPLIGHAWKMLGGRKRTLSFIKTMSKETLEKGGISSFTVGHHKYYVITDPDDCATVSNACLDKGYGYNFAKPFLGNGLTIADVPLWKQHRKNISPTFRQQILNEFFVVFNHQAKRLVSQFKPKVAMGPFNPEKYTRLNSLESMCITTFGADVSDFGGLHKKYLEGVKEILEIFAERFHKPWLHSNFIYNLSSLKTRQDEVIRNINNFTGLIFENKKAEMERNCNVNKPGQFTPFINLILELSKETGCYSDEDVLSEINTLVAAGSDTSTFTVTLVMIMLGSYPEVQKKAYEEQHGIFDNSDRDVDKYDLPKMVYLEAVLKETLRLYPLVPIVGRYIARDMQLKNYTLKAGNGVALLFWAMHRHAVWGPDAEQFRPERWLDGSLPSNPNAFGGFSLGRRGCIGKTYAMMSMKTYFSHLLRNFSITSDVTKLEFEMDTLLRAVSGQNISIEERIS